MPTLARLLPTKRVARASERHVVHEPEVHRDVRAARLQRAPAAAERVLADRVEDHVVRLAVLREVLAQAIDDVARAQRPHELDVLRVAHRGHVGLEVVREQLHRGSSDRACGAVDEDALPVQRIRRPQAGQREQRAVGDRRRLLVRQRLSASARSRRSRARPRTPRWRPPRSRTRRRRPGTPSRPSRPPRRGRRTPCRRSSASGGGCR